MYSDPNNRLWTVCRVAKVSTVVREKEVNGNGGAVCLVGEDPISGIASRLFVFSLLGFGPKDIIQERYNWCRMSPLRAKNLVMATVELSFGHTPQALCLHLNLPSP
jgi:hypothetical protein